MASRNGKIAAATVVAVLAIPACAPKPVPVPPSKSVALIVLDDFDQVTTSAPTTTPPKGTTDANDNCQYQSIATNEVGSKGGGDIPPGVSHGAVVMDVLRREIQAFPSWKRTQESVDKSAYGIGSDAVKVAEMWSRSNDPDAGLLLIGMHVAHYRTSEIVASLNSIVNGLKDPYRKHVERFVINMSFVVAPCEVGKYADLNTQDVKVLLQMYKDIIDDEEAAPDVKQFKKAIDDLAGVKAERAIRDALRAMTSVTKIFQDENKFDALPQHLQLAVLYSPQHNGEGSPRADILPAVIAQDPLNNYLTGLVTKSTDGSRVVPVAAAGNGITVHPTGSPAYSQRLNFPFAPAIWKNVVSVSAATRRKEDPNPDRECVDTALPSPLTRAWYANSGEVILDGDTEYYEAPGKCDPFTGTSFAAPRLSYQEALYLLEVGRDSCSVSSPGDAATWPVPPLGYVESDDVGYLTHYLPWANTEVNAAARKYCPNFVDKVKARQ